MQPRDAAAAQGAIVLVKHMAKFCGGRTAPGEQAAIEVEAHADAVGQQHGQTIAAIALRLQPAQGDRDHRAVIGDGDRAAKLALQIVGQVHIASGSDRRPQKITAFRIRAALDGHDDG